MEVGFWTSAEVGILFRIIFYFRGILEKKLHRILKEMPDYCTYFGNLETWTSHGDMETFRRRHEGTESLRYGDMENGDIET
jgi:hypothetical protein